MKKILTLLIICIQLLSVVNVSADELYEGEASIQVLSNNANTQKAKAPVVDAWAAIVMDMKSGRILYEKNAYSKRAIASTTKIMTAILAIENGNLDDNVTVSKRAAEIWGSTINLKAGETLKLRELLYGLLLNSGNDAAIAIAEHIGGSVEGFLDMMNKKAEELGAKDTHFMSPHGLDSPEHYSTAYDLANITRYALSIPTLSKIVGTQSAQIPGRSLYNTNELLGAYPGADGVKTGYTGQAGRCLVASATRDKWRIISVALGCSTRTKRAQSSSNILDYAFNNYKPRTLVKCEENIGNVGVIRGVKKNVPVLAAEEVSLPLRSDEQDAIQKQVYLPESIDAPVYTGIEVGTVKYFLNGKEIASMVLKTGDDVRKKNFFDYLEEILDAWASLIKQVGDGS